MRFLAIAIGNLRFFGRRFRGRLGRQKPVPERTPGLVPCDRTDNMKTALGSLATLDLVVTSLFPCHTLSIAESGFLKVE